MFVEDLRNDFYNVLLGKRVLLLVHYDVDAICTCKILQGLFKCDNISYTLVPVGGVSEMKTAYEENNEEIKYVVLVNCGGTIDLVDILQPEEDVVFFVLDCHKPTDICNVYSDGQVRIVYKDNEENIPNFDDIFRDDEDEEEEPRESGMEALEAAVERRRGRRAWEERRHTLMFNYTQFSYYGKPSACVALEVAWMVSRCGWAALWAASVAAAAHIALALRAPAQCLLDADALHRRIAAAQHAPADTSCRVVLEKDSWLPLYRVWSLEGALKHAPSIAPHLKLHTHAGAARLRQLLADMGIPLQQARQAYRSMDVELRHSATSALEAAAERLHLPAPSRAAFLLQRPHAPPLPAHDVLYALLALMHHLSSESKVCLECIEIIRTQAQEAHPIRDYGHKSVCLGCGVSLLRARSININRHRPEFNIIERWVPQIQETIPQGEGFQHALAALDVEGGINDSLRLGLEGARAALEAVARLAHATLSGRRLQLAGPFSYFIVQEGVPEARWVRGPHWLGVAARWVAAATGGARPLVASAPRGDASCILLGVPPRVEQEPRNLFGAAFEQAAAKSGASVSLELMDSSVVTLPTAQRPQFLDALTALLA